MPKAFDFRELVTWCTKRFNSKHRLIELKERRRMHVPLTPNTFVSMLRLPKLEKFLKLPETDSFLDAQGGGMSFLKEFLVQPLVGSSNISEINTCMLANSFKEFSWIFS
jgi:hypothetical protein